MTPPDTAPPVVWACFLGANNPYKLASEWRCSVRYAYWALDAAMRKKLLVRIGHIPRPKRGRGHQSTPVYRVAT